MSSVAKTPPAEHPIREPVVDSTAALAKELGESRTELQRVAAELRTRIQALEDRMLGFGGLQTYETNRLDYALAHVEGVSQEFEAFRRARRTPGYRLAFQYPEPLVSVCCATFNRAEILVERCLRSLIGQSYRNLQIVVVGDHCTDDTAARIAQLGDDRIVFHNLPVRGPYPKPGRARWCVAGSTAINKALSLCEGQFVTHLDDDDSAVPDRIETLVRVARQAEADLVHHAFWYQTSPDTWGTLGNGTLELGQVTTSAIFYHHYFRKFHWDVNAYRLDEPGDWNRLRKIRMLRPRLAYVDRPLVYHHQEQRQTAFEQQDGETFLD